MHLARILLLSFVLALSVGAWSGCSSQQETKTVETTTTTQPAPAPTTATTTTTTTTTTTDEGHESVLGATAHFVWAVVSFPFRVIGDVIGEIV